MIDGGDPERGQDDDVDLGVAEDPEQVLPQQRIAAVGGVVEVKAELAVELQEQGRDAQRRKREQQRERDGQERKAEQRHPVQRHPRRAQLEDRDDEVDRGRGARDPVEDQPVAVEVDVVAGVELLGGQRHVVEPAGVRRVPVSQRDVHEDPRAQIDPVREGVHPRERHVPRADHQRDQVVPERPRGHRDHEQEDHRDPVHREHLVVGRRARADGPFGPISCVRISSASTPPAPKNASEVKK